MRKIHLFFNSLFLSLLFAAAASGAVFTVTKTADTNDGVCDADCSLREAVTAADAGVGGNTVKFSPSLIGTPIVLTAGEIQLISANITGPGANQITISGNNSSRIFFVPAGNALTISGVTLTGGNGVGVVHPSPGGGAVRAEGIVHLDGVNFTANSVSGSNAEGSAILYTGVAGVKIRNSTFSNNLGVGVYFTGQSTASIYNSTFVEGPGFFTPVLHLIGTPLKMRNCTVEGMISIGGLSGLDVGNSVVGHAERTSMLGGMTSQGNNIFMNTATTGNPVSYHATDQLNVNPLLDTINNNGGTTPTLALLPGSPAIDAGSNAQVIAAGYAIDQRRYARTVDGNGDMNAVADIGAYEFGSTPVVPISFSGRVHDAAGSGVGRATVTVTDSEGNIRSVTTSPLGYFVLNDIYVGNILVEISAKSHRFTPITIYATENIANMELAVQ
ncbi:MAG TPA: choice-of-anchor Q domain-containing protein [Pyrinomonadaceae bacterium]|jgi:CSLREA domain-containing protein|nr:choice-of-anchor Q domain-containing protein [Pyrinomonadaceae bacterium]